MSWEFGPEVVDQIIYAMENQETDFVLDFETGQVLAADDVEDPDEDRYFDVPVWTSHEGFQLMERFVAGLRNPLHRESLRDALSAGRGVFRQFKNALKGHPELEELWFGFKEREMRRLVYEWYNEICEVRGLARLELPLEEIEELILSDFLLVGDVGGQEDAIRALDREVFAMSYPDADPQAIERAFTRRREAMPEPGAGVLIRAEAPSGELAGFVWGVLSEHEITGEEIVELVQIAVVAEFRGLGLGRALLEEFVAAAERRGAARVSVRLEGRHMVLGSLLEQEGFKAVSQTMQLDLDSWSARAD